MNRARSRLETVIERLYNDRIVLRPEGLTTRPHTDSYLSGDFILMCFGNTAKRNQFLSFSRKIRPCWKKFLYHLLPNMIIHTHSKFALLDFINKKNERETLPKPNFTFTVGNWIESRISLILPVGSESL